MADGDSNQPSDWDRLRKSGGGRLLNYAIVVFVIGVTAYVPLALVGKLEAGTGIIIALSGISIALAIAAAVELRFYEIKMTLREIERTLQELKASSQS